MKTYNRQHTPLPGGLLGALLTALLVLLTMTFASPAEAEEKLYIINIASSLKNFSEKSLPKITIEDNQVFYTSKVNYRKKEWNSLRLGFFKTKEAATKTLNKIKKRYPDAFLGLVSSTELQLSIKTAINKKHSIAEQLLVKLEDTLTATPSITIPISKKPSTEEDDKKLDIENYYIISLLTANNLSKFTKILKHKTVQKHVLYISELEIDNRIWYQYRIGFFINEKLAESALKNIKDGFPVARIIRISKAEKQLATKKIRAFNSTFSPSSGIPRKTKHPENARTVYQKLIKKGSGALSVNNYKKAINAFNELLSYPENSFSMDAQELVGFAYELNKQIAYARHSYEQYLSLYPESKGATRVQQRLASLITARKSTPKGLRDAKGSKLVPKWEIFGSISQFYRRDTSSFDINTETETSVINITDDRVNVSEIDSILNLNARHRSDDYDLRARFTGGYIYDLQNDNNESNELPINEVYFDALDIKNNANARVGRQRTNKGGVFGRFDGIDTGYQVNDWVKVNFTTGYLVPSITESANTDAFFTSFKVDFGTFFNAWDFSLYYMQQDEGEVSAREAIGTEFRYFHPRRSLFGLIDHDILFDETNTILLNGSWTLPNKVSLNGAIDIRQSPLLTIQNALQGQPFETIKDMLNSFSEDLLLDFASDRTAEVKTFIVGMSMPLSKSYTFNTDITSSKISATDASAGVEAFPATDTEYFVNAQLVGNHMFKQNDSSIVGINYNDTTHNNTLTLRWNYRLPYTQKIRLNPRVSIATRDNDDDTSQSIVGLAFKMDYRRDRHTSFEVELNSETSDKSLVSGQEKNDLFYINIGYHHNF